MIIQLSISLPGPAVIPVFTNIGVTLLPSFLAAVLSALTVLVNPRMLVVRARQRPGAVSAIGAAIIVLSVFGCWLAVHSRASTVDDTAVIDWPRVALALIEAREHPSADDGTGDGSGPIPVAFAAAWRYPAGGMVLTSPLAAAGRVYGGTARPSFMGTTGTLFCLDAKTGEELWRADGSEPQDERGTGRSAANEPDSRFKGFFSSPALSADGRYVIVGQGLHEDNNCSLLCFEADSGRLHWRVPTELHIESSPAVAGDIVVVGCGAIERSDGKPAGNPGFVLAVRVSDGTELWRYPLADPESSPTIADGIVYIGSGVNGNAVAALRIESDAALQAAGQPRLLWSVDTRFPMVSAVAVAEDLVVAAGGNGDYVISAESPAGIVLAFDRRTGAIRWRQEAIGDTVLGAPVIAGDKIICTSRRGEVLALALNDGAIRWRRRVRENDPILAGVALAGRVEGSPIADWVAYTVTSSGWLARLDAADGRILETHFINDNHNPGFRRLSLSTPIIADGWLYVGSETGGLRAFFGTRR